MTALLHSIADVREHLGSRLAGTAGLVPTMGALHAGHAQLIDVARTECDAVVVSIFVNPLQFDRKDDLEKYPRTLREDLSLCSEKHVDYVFAPSSREMYPIDPLCTINIARIGDHLCGRFRPGHFEGVATVVSKLFNIVRPDRAYFGEKDAQQLAIIRRLVADLNMPATIVAVPTFRERDGLAISSRNQHLSPAERQQAPLLYQILCRARDLVSAGMIDTDEIRRTAVGTLPSGVRLEYLEIVDGDMQPVQRIAGPVHVMGALWIGNTRLIDNVEANSI